MVYTWDGFELTEVVVEFVVGDTDKESVITAFRLKGGTDLDFGVVGMWLVDAEGTVDFGFPEEKGRYRMCAYWHDTKEYFCGAWDLVKLD
jgi:hypothetical protein